MPGLYTQVKFSFTPEQKVYIIPVGALIIRTGPPFVAVVANNTVHLQEVKIGRDYGRTIEIIEGLKEDQDIITAPTDLTKEGMQVKPVPLAKEEQAQLMGS